MILDMLLEELYYERECIKKDVLMRQYRILPTVDSRSLIFSVDAQEQKFSTVITIIEDDPWIKS